MPETPRDLARWLAVLLVGWVGSHLEAQEWTRFRGPNGSGISSATTVPTEWCEEDLNWKVELPGEGHSQPVLWGERIFLTSAEGDGSERLVLCLRAVDGTTLWARRRSLPSMPKNGKNTDASSTPAVDGERVYVVFGSTERCLLLALDHWGDEVWSVDLGPFEGEHGVGASPAIFGDLVVYAHEHDGPSFILAVDRRTGATVWRTERRVVRAAYGTPCGYREADGREALLFTSQAYGISSLDAASGRLIWEAPVFDKRAVSSPVFADGLAFGTCGSGGGGNYLVAVRTGGEGDVSGSHVAYRLDHSIPYVPTPLARDGLLFLWAEKGLVTCAEIDSGKVLWTERAGRNFFGSPICVGDRLYAMSEEGEVVVLAAGREFRLLARNPLGEGSRSTPAVSGGVLYLRTYTHLISVGGKRPEAVAGTRRTAHVSAEGLLDGTGLPGDTGLPGAPSGRVAE